ncbi:MAG: hypothetical protein LN588_02560 [Rickettsia endosymbiont of Bryobia graminum]|nr:hypothetical protein [Rickettsia endosymbiont of Bryobia graminum]
MKSSIDDKTMLMTVDPILIAKSFIDNYTEGEKALSLLSKAYYSNMFAKLAYDNIISTGNYYDPKVQNNLYNYSACTYPVNNNDVSGNWMLKDCVGKVADNIFKIATIFGTTAYIGGASAGIISGAGATAAYCFIGGYDGSLMDDGGVPFTGGSSKSGDISEICDIYGNCHSFK